MSRAKHSCRVKFGFGRRGEIRGCSHAARLRAKWMLRRIEKDCGPEQADMVRMMLDACAREGK